MTNISNKEVCIVTDFCPNGSLLEYLTKNKGNISDEKMLSFAEEIALGMVCFCRI
jgi:serine/threonine protein kinase